MIKELIFRFKVKKLDEIHIRQYLERQGYEILYLKTERANQVLKKLELEDIDNESFVYDGGRFKYVFLGKAKNDDDKLMALLHECGHIELKHKSISKYHEAQAWSFAYNLTAIHLKLLKFFVTVALSAIITFALVNINVDNSSAPSSTPAHTQSDDKVTPEPESSNDTVPDVTSDTLSESDASASDIVYVTPSGEKYHVAGCRYIKGKDVKELTESEAKTDYLPCKICIGN